MSEIPHPAAEHVSYGLMGRFERYGEAFSPDNPVVDIYVPVKTKS
jgi:predicted transcriptional regulator YdeE